MLKTLIIKLRNVVIGVAVILVSLWALLTQPFTGEVKLPLATPANPELLEQHVVMLSETLPARDHNPLNLDKSAQYIFDVFANYGEPEFLQFDVRGVIYRNVALKIAGKSDESVIIGAHYDSFAGLPGADDNASGVAGLLELARMFHSQPPPITIFLIAYALEEPPYFGTEYMGSSNHAMQASKWPRPPALMISLEMIGYFDDSPGSQSYPLPWLSHFYSDSGDFIAIVSRWNEIFSVRRIKAAFSGNTGLKTYSLSSMPIIPGMTFSDHANYWAAGIDAVMITDTAFERNPNYHTARDTSDSLDFRRMAEVVNGSFSAVTLLGRAISG